MRNRRNGRQQVSSKTVAIVGSHTLTRDGVPWHDKGVDIWLFNESASIGWPKRVDGVFQMHAAPVWKNPLNRNDPKYPEWMRQEHPYPIWMLERYEEVPASRSYPLEAICKRFLAGLTKGRAMKRFLTSSPAFALALAIHKNYQRIEIYGIEMESDTEYNLQRAGVFFWIGLALGRGIQVHIQEKSHLFSDPLYGYEGGAYLGREQLLARRGILLERKTEADAELEAANDQHRVTLEKAMEESGGEPGMAAVATARDYFIGIKRQTEAIMAVGMFIGALGEVDRYLLKCEQMDRESGWHMLARQEFELTAAQANGELEKRKSQVNVLGAEARSAWKAIEAAVKEERELAQLDGLSQKYSEAHQAYVQAAFELGRVNGAMKENITLLDEVDRLLRAAGGEKAEEALLMAKIESETKEVEVSNG